MRGGSRRIAAHGWPASARSGTRRSCGVAQRAVVGSAGVSDAIVLVVSEETGNISVAHKGRIKVGLSSTELQAELMRLSASEEPQHSHHEHAAQRG